MANQIINAQNQQGYVFFFETEFFENPGCNTGSNSFLLHINAIAGEEYKLLVIVLMIQIKSDAVITFYGTATWENDDSPCFLLGTNKPIEKSRYSVFSNPLND